MSTSAQTENGYDTDDGTPPSYAAWAAAQSGAVSRGVLERLAIPGRPSALPHEVEAEGLEQVDVIPGAPEVTVPAVQEHAEAPVQSAAQAPIQAPVPAPVPSREHQPWTPTPSTPAPAAPVPQQPEPMSPAAQAPAVEAPPAEAPPAEAPVLRAPGGRAGPSGSGGAPAGSYASLRPLVAHLTTDARGVVLSVDSGFTGILGWTATQIVGRRIGEFVHREDIQRGLASWGEVLKRPGGVGPGLRLRYRHRDDTWVWMDVTNRNRLEDPHHADVLSEMVDVTREMEVLDHLRVREQLLAHVNEAVPLGLFHADNAGRLLYVNQRLLAMTGVPAATTLGEQLAAVAEGDRARLRAAVQGATAGSESGVELTMVDAEGERRHWTLRLRPVLGSTGIVTGITGCVEDVSALGTSSSTERPRVTTDALTGCLTPEATMVTLSDMLQRHRALAAAQAHAASAGPDWVAQSGPTAGTRGRGTAVLMLDIDGLQAINDRHGETAGDELLTVVALRIIDTVRSSDIVGRAGGDEFLILCGGVPGPTTAVTIGRSILEQVCQPVHLRSAGSLSVRAHVGVSWTNRTDANPADLVHRAHEAMLASKVTESSEPVLAAQDADDPA